MEAFIDMSTCLTGVIIFFARIVDVSVGTIRLLAIVSGRTFLAFLLGFIEISLWLVVIAKVLNEISQKPLLGVFFAFGFSAGSVVGIMIDKRIALGHVVLKVFTRCDGGEIAENIRKTGFLVTMFHGEGEFGPVTELYMVCKKRDLKRVVLLVKVLDPEAFYLTEPVLSVSKKLTNFFYPLSKIDKEHNLRVGNGINQILSPVTESVR
ncbi:MAG: DUF2179 domain-containing protein [Candidatus Scalindua sp. AMX11]|nr:MAG: DUF2179 domain-containing protein [Candidatus Scalindua sp.]NOG84740.1 DUF2179 domain-containing protein [Planctomycetota bacterium]RZV98346.1 MAG: DUF2179 domain-containing protein [Candidatus Scalindua sp. SCAELEC01]TDE66561.1 MAG: DUF2179 domain-containing protein [Candidatus Scalindua sp. AMX11]GJQ58931.1 MAG: hypothetical protein SCALA701_17320 [Candidatus Scalindua sp.]